MTVYSFIDPQTRPEAIAPFSRTSYNKASKK